ncbi:hypothetical protein GE21DRAFT_7778 [Neurospora crassa]|uniref:Uncharacterized protein n=2 Tax=Neurospora crassa TaxID=5141 RepID=Q1K7T1_NEUCR|nr:hypothetical protein NCU01347 [Neurospora crassa OR74A]EAA32197.1 hypothetical protein NCU01347 [Neurospora crassa OR74A]KHE83461.1 hypothetical protein GE21DRAFT_7778 [Neurospora crassa]CAC28792.1 conserved hypothetical protein [Neurospora crassa]|eukprot:XP_961433.1 hypothetical protein NCU01347 [Neurospora crassa OR74A]
MLSSSSTSGSQQQPPIILYHYPFSPYAKRIVWYLHLRGIPYTQCLQPMILPRPDLSSLLGIKYRRIPLLSIGRDVYLDTRLILSKLEDLDLPSLNPKLSAAPGTDALALQSLLSHYSIDGGLFSRAAQLLFSLDNPLLRDPQFLADRADFVAGGGAGNAPPSQFSSREEMAALGPEALADLRDYCQMLETTVLADGRNWILKNSTDTDNDNNNNRPGLADIEAVFVLHWVMSLPGALPKEQFNDDKFPRVWKWVERFRVAVGETTTPTQQTAAQKKGDGNNKVATIKGDKARDLILGARWNEDSEKKEVEAGEAIVQFHGLKKGTLVEVWPTDSGSAPAHRDVGRLVSLDSREVVIENEKGVRVHAPRHGFRVKPSLQAVASSL